MAFARALGAFDTEHVELSFDVTEDEIGPPSGVPSRLAKKSPAAERGLGLGASVVHFLAGGHAAWYP